MTAVVTSPRTARFVAVEFAIWAVVYGSYLVLRSAAIARPDEALKHAHAVVGLEQTLGLFQEAQIQHASDAVAGLLSAYLLISIAIASRLCRVPGGAASPRPSPETPSTWWSGPTAP